MLADTGVREILLKQYKLYPKMQIQDMVKLLYQQEFAGGHLIADEKESLKNLEAECIAIKNDLISENMLQLFEEIGSGLCRINLKAIFDTDIDLKTVNRFFVNTANSVKGNMESFEKKLYILRQCCRDEYLPYPLEEVKDFLAFYKKQGCPPLSHSEIYRSLYSPAYRVIRREFCDFFKVFRRIDSLLRAKKDTIKIAIDGKSGAGKSSLAILIGSVYDSNVFQMDDFFLTPELKTPERMLEVGGNVDYVRFGQEIINGLNSGEEFRYRKYDCKTQNFNQLIHVNPQKLNIIEGSYSMHPTLINNYDLRIFLDIDAEEQSKRILKRNGPAMHKRFITEWIPMENLYFHEMKIQAQSDFVYGK